MGANNRAERRAKQGGPKNRQQGKGREPGTAEDKRPEPVFLCPRHGERESVRAGTTPFWELSGD
ncbi:hypothetical protein J31TS4_35600 [Paenibacillus sp. J31TS4]|nr:hypothetical protein J31TS4_35600 [Paenibacillus sp. J31TS4]